MAHEIAAEEIALVSRARGGDPERRAEQGELRRVLERAVRALPRD